MNMQQSEIVHHRDGGITLAGPDATNLFRAVLLCQHLKLFAKTRIIPTRGVTGAVMLRLAKQYTGKTYKRGQYMQAAADIQVWVDTMRAAIPTTVEGEKQ